MPLSPDDTANPQRRSFLKFGISVGVAAGGGLLLGVDFSAAAKDHPASVRPTIGSDADLTPRRGRFAPNAFIQIDSAGQVTLVMPKVEMGQGIYTAIPMLIAEELEVPLDSVQLVHAPPNEKLYNDALLGGQLTGGSTSIRWAWEPMRQAGATARVMLQNAAASQWRVEPATCHAERGAIVHAASGRRLGYGQLADAAARLPLPTHVPLKAPRDFKLIGTRVKRLDGAGKTDGSTVFGIDVRLPGMLYAAIVNCPVLGGTLHSVDDTVTLRMPGVRKVVRFDNGVAVIGDHTWAARRGADALQIQWNEGRGATYSSATVMTELAAAARRNGVVARRDGSIAQGFKNAHRRVDAVYRQPFLAHAPMEPVNCTVSVRADGCDLWVGTQIPTRAVDIAAHLTGLPVDKVTLHSHLLGGGFGRRLEVDFIGQAVKVGMQVAAPVKVTWTREEDIQHDVYRPTYLDTISAGLDSAGRPVAWQHRIAGSSVFARFAPGAIVHGVDPDAVGVSAELPYDLPNQFVDFVRQEPQSVPTGFWRGVGPTRGTFVVESFIDELAAQTRTDPVAYRRALLGKSPRALHVLDVAARAAGWGAPMPPHHGRGVSVMNAFGSFLGMVVDASVDDAGEVTVKRVVCAVDCGMVVNPDTVEAQIQGGIIFGITAALYSEITIKDGRVQQSNFNDYRMLRINETPIIEVHIVASAEAPGGIGEPGTAALAPALTNAIYAATGKRLRTLPVGRQLQRT